MLGANEKVSYFQPYAPHIYEDGTFEQLALVVKMHAQDNVMIIERAADEISRYITFCMEHWEETWNLEKNKYTHIPKKGDKTDPFDRLIHFHPDNSKWSGLSVVHIDDEVEDAHLSELLKVKKELLAVRYSPQQEDLNRWEKYKCDVTGTYGFLLSKMLDGHTYFSD